MKVLGRNSTKGWINGKHLVMKGPSDPNPRGETGGQLIDGGLRQKLGMLRNQVPTTAQAAAFVPVASIENGILMMRCCRYFYGSTEYES